MDYTIHKTPSNRSWVGLLATAAFLFACGPAPELATGRVQLPLVSSASNGRMYVLQGAEVEVIQPTGLVTTMVGNDLDDTENLLSAQLAVGDYTARLQDGWQVAERRSDGTVMPLVASLRGSAEHAFTISNTATTTIRYVFDVPGASIVFGGTLEVGFDVRAGFPNLPAKVAGPCVYETDYNGDGRADSRRELRYDDRGQTIFSAGDWDGDGVTDSRSFYEYDTAGNLIRMRSDNNGDGSIDQVYTSTYDLNGNRLRSRSDSDGDGVDDYGHDYVYDLNGNQVAVYDYYEAPFEPSGYDSRATFEYDAQGRKVLYERDANNSAGRADGVADSRIIYSYSRNGLVQRLDEDSDADGVIDYSQTITHDANGHELERVYDSNLDGVIDGRSFSTYDASGRKLSDGWDHDADGVADELSINEYDEQGNVVRQVDMFDGRTQQVREYEYDSHGNLLLASTDSDGDGIVDGVTLTDYSCWGGSQI